MRGLIQIRVNSLASTYDTWLTAGVLSERHYLFDFLGAFCECGARHVLNNTEAVLLLGALSFRYRPENEVGAKNFSGTIYPQKLQLLK